MHKLCPLIATFTWLGTRSEKDVSGTGHIDVVLTGRG